MEIEKKPTDSGPVYDLKNVTPAEMMTMINALNVYIGRPQTASQQQSKYGENLRRLRSLLLENLEGAEYEF